MKERWREVPSCPGYKVSDRGSVSGLEGIMKPSLNNGYWAIYPIVNGKKVMRKVHRLVMEAFVGPSELDVNHKDADKLNNNLGNLEYCTHLENMRHAFAMGLVSRPLGEKHFRSKLSNSDVLKLKKQLKEGRKHKEIAEEFGITTGTVSNINTGYSWSHLKLKKETA